jgi:zinc/manganese transport system substrate-binding protein
MVRTDSEPIGSHPRASLKIVIIVAAIALSATAVEAAIRVVATTSSMGMLARVVGGDAVDVTVLAPPDRDAHYLLARPSMMLALRRAELLITVGASLEVGWLPAALQGASNAKILPGQRGYFEGAAQLVLIEGGQPADRALGDVHPAGNPHFYMDPERMATLALAVADRLALLDPDNTTDYEARATDFAEAVEARVPGWRASAADAAGVVLYHRDINYLAAFLGVPVLGYLEPISGIPPTASHLRDLAQSLAGTQGVILHTSFQPRDGPEFLARTVGWTRIQLQLEVPLDADGAGYLDHIETWVEALVGSES